MAALEIPNFPEILMETLVSVPEASRVGFLARLERSAAGRYRGWATESDDLAPWLLECAAREDEIADRAEEMFPVLPEHEEIVEEALAVARRLYLGAFEGHPLEDQIFIQAHAERQGSLAWLGYASQHADESTRKQFLELADLEVASALRIDAELGRSSSGEA
ncbi:MAG: hypothetical protein CL910_00295 [Deltaproteobacteria bacterium]|jgi:hypothetical protein|nr:hypothetical protein [Deltaproteobacteria bacterium]